jgi:hypothetical protein
VTLWGPRFFIGVGAFWMPMALIFLMIPSF